MRLEQDRERRHREMQVLRDLTSPIELWKLMNKIWLMIRLHGHTPNIQTHRRSTVLQYRPCNRDTSTSPAHHPTGTEETYQSNKNTAQVHTQWVQCLVDSGRLHTRLHIPALSP